MVAFGHTAVGAIIGDISYKNFAEFEPALGLGISFGVGILSHYLFDAIPHGHFIAFKNFKQKVIYAIIFDLAFSILLYAGLSFYYHKNSLHTLYILSGVFGSQIPDVIDGLIYIGKLPNSGLIKLENDIHLKTHWHGVYDKALKFGVGDLWQIGVFVLGFVILFNL